MPVYNITVDDASPLIQYDGWWTDSSHGDPAYIEYRNQTFHPTSMFNGTARLTFNGSAVYLFGAKRANHDVYSVILDGHTTTGHGYSAADSFQQMLFNQTGLSPSQEHHISLSNTPSSSTLAYTDLDYVVITAGDGDDSTQSKDTFWDAGVAQYSSGWDDSPDGFQSNYFNSTMHRTNMMHASATVTLEGNAIAVYGATSMNHGFFNVSLDNSPPITLNGTIPSDQPGPRYQNLLYWAGGLSSGQHTVTVTNIDSRGLWLDLDMFVVSHWSQPSTQSSGSAGHATGAIAGGVVAGLIVVVLIATGLLFYLRRRRRRGRGNPSPERRYGILFGDTDTPLGWIEPFVPASWTSNALHEHRPLPHAVLVADPPGVLPPSKMAGRASRCLSPSGPDMRATPVLALTPNSELVPQPVENPHQDFPPPNYEQAAAAGISSRGPLPLPALFLQHSVPPLVVQSKPPLPSRKP